VTTFGYDFANNGVTVQSGAGLVADTDGTLAANSDANVATEKAVKTYVDAGLALKSPTASPTFSGTVADAGTLQHYQAGGPEDLYGTVDPSLGAGVAAPVGSFYHRVSALAGGVITDEFYKYAAAATAWTRTKRSPILAGGVFAAAYPAALRAASATQERDVNRAILADQTFTAQPAALFQCDEAANGNAVDAIGGVIAIAASGGDATRGASAYADGVLDRGLITVKDSDNWWRIVDTTAIDPGSAAFVVDITTKVTVGLAAQTSGFVGKYNNKGWFATALTGGSIAIYCTDGTNSATVTLAFNHIDGAYHRILLGRSVTAGKFFITTDLGDTTVNVGSVGSLQVAGSFGLGVASGTHVAGASQTATKLAYYTGADAEAMYTNRVALTGARWSTT
jgi:hypothetical protein